MEVRKNIWKVYILLMEQCCKLDYQTVIEKTYVEMKVKEVEFEEKLKEQLDIQIKTEIERDVFKDMLTYEKK